MLMTVQYLLFLTVYSIQCSARTACRLQVASEAAWPHEASPSAAAAPSCSTPAGLHSSMQGSAPGAPAGAGCTSE
jgi:hypothetical protein